MSNDTIVLEAHKREVLGKKVKALRAAGKTPAVIHDHGKDSMHIAVEERELKKVYSSAGKHHPVVVKLDGKSYTTLIKDVTNKPATAIIYHTVFQAVSANETVKTEVPVKLIGEIPAEKASLLVLQNLDVVEVEGLPKNLIDTIEVDASHLEKAGDKLTVAELQVPEGITVLTDPENVLATVEMPKDQIAEADAAAAELAADAGTDGEEEAPAAEEGGEAPAAENEENSEES